MKPAKAVELRYHRKIAKRTYREVMDLQEDHENFIMMPTRDKAPFIHGWRKWTKSYNDSGWEKCNGYGIICGKKTGLMVIDVDNKDDTVAWFDKFVEHFNLEPTTWVNTPSGGYHLYYKYTDAITGCDFGPGTNIDLRTEGHYIIGPNSYYFVDQKPKNEAKFKYEGLQYKFKEVGEDRWDFDKLKPLPDVFVRMKKYGINRETMEFGTTCLVSQTKAQHTAEVSDTNKRLFIDLMKAYTNYTENSRTEWLHGVWSVAVVAKKYYWDAEKVAVAWCSSIPKYEGPSEIRKKLREFDPNKSHGFGLKYILRRVSDKAREAFADFKRLYWYHDYIEILKHNRDKVNREIVKQYLSSTFIRIDRMGKLTWFTKDSCGRWQSIEQPFKDTEVNVVFKYDGQKEWTSIRKELCRHMLDWIPNYRDFTFHPYLKEDEAPPKDIFNSFNGYRHKLLPDGEYNEQNDDFQFVMNHWKEYMCNGNKEYFKYLMDWLASVIQKGYCKPRTAIVMFSKQGCGKGLMWVELMWKGVLGQDLGHSVTDLAVFTKNFNYDRLYKCLHIFNECTGLNLRGADKVSWDKVKSIITDKEFRMEMKYKNAVMAEDCAGCVFLSNHDHCVKVENDDRRYAIIQSKLELPGAKYYKRLADLVQSHGIQRTFFTYLARRDLSKFDISKIPQTEARRDFKERAYSNTIYMFLKELVTGEYGPIKKARFGDAVDHRAVAYHKSQGVLFDTEANEQLQPRERWHSQEMLWDNYLSWLKVNQPTVVARGRPAVVTRLKQAGLETRQMLCRTTKNRVVCWRIDKNVVRELHRKALSEPSWNY